MAEKFATPPSRLVGLRFSREDCDLGVSYDFDQAIRLRLQYKDREDYEDAKEAEEQRIAEEQAKAKAKANRRME